MENGNRELVTVIECVCADSTAIQLSVVFQGICRNLEWGRNNPCNARSAIMIMHEYMVDLTFDTALHSPKSWTDQELGLAWLE